MCWFQKITNIDQMCRFLDFMAKKRILERNYEKCYIYFNKNNNFQDILLRIGMYTLYIVPKIVLKFHNDVSNDYRNINQISGLSSPKLGILHIKVHLLWNRDKMLAPRIAFPVSTEYVQVKERKKINFQITFFFQLSVSHKVITLSPYCSYIFLHSIRFCM